MTFTTNLNVRITGNSYKNSHTYYRIQGTYDELEIDIGYRYSEFALFRDTLIHRFPGIYIPPIPPKKIVNWEKKFLS